MKHSFNIWRDTSVVVIIDGAIRWVRKVLLVVAVVVVTEDVDVGSCNIDILFGKKHRHKWIGRQCVMTTATTTCDRGVKESFMRGGI